MSRQQTGQPQEAEHEQAVGPAVVAVEPQHVAAGQAAQVADRPERTFTYAVKRNELPSVRVTCRASAIICPSVKTSGRGSPAVKWSP